MGVEKYEYGQGEKRLQRRIEAKDGSSRAGGRDARELVEASWQDKHHIFKVCLPISLFSTAIAMGSLTIRRWELVPERYLASIDHPYAAQVLGFSVGYLLVMRLNLGISRWDSGMSSAQLMEAKWNDAFVQLVTFIEAAKKKAAADQNKLRVLDRAEQDLVHFFSLLHAIACINLYYGEGQPYGINSAEGAQVYQHLFQVPFDDERGAVKPLWAIEDPRTVLPDGATMSRAWWPYNLAVLGELTDEEDDGLACSQRQPHLVFMWLTRLISTMMADGFVTIPPPIYSRVYQEMSNGMLGFMEAYKISVLPFPIPLTQMTEVLLAIQAIFIPFVVERFTKAMVFTPFFTFFSVFGMFCMHAVTMQLEMPFGDDFIDLPLREMHCAFNSSLLQPFMGSPEKDPLKHLRSTPFCDPNWMESSAIAWETSTRKKRVKKAPTKAAPEAPVFVPAATRQPPPQAAPAVETDIRVISMNGEGKDPARVHGSGPSREEPPASRSDGVAKRDASKGSEPVSKGSEPVSKGSESRGRSPSDRVGSAPRRARSAPRRRGRSSSPVEAEDF